MRSLRRWVSAAISVAALAAQPDLPPEAALLARIKQRAVENLSTRLADQSMAGAIGHGGGDEQLRELARGVNQLVTQMRAEQKVVREWVDEQASQHSEVASALKELAVNMRRKG